MLLKHKNLDFQVKRVEETGVFEGYASVFNVKDSYGDVVLPGAFNESIGKKAPKILWQHRGAEPIGVHVEAKEDEHGLFVKAKLALKTSKGAEAYELLKIGAIDGISIGYLSQVERWDKEKEILYLEKIDLWEYSIVTFPACDHATVSAVKAVDEIITLADAEDYLRESGGFSKAQALAIVSKVKAIGKREATTKLELEELAKRSIRILES